VPKTLSVRSVVTILVSLVNAIGITFVFCTLLTSLTLVSNFCVKMDRLLPETQEQLKKMSFTRLVAKLSKAGFDPNHLKRLEQADLLEAMAYWQNPQLFREAQEASQIPFPAGDSSSAASDGGSAAVRLRKLKLEKRRAERKERKAAREAENRNAAREAEAQRLGLEIKVRKKAAGDKG